MRAIVLALCSAFLLVTAVAQRPRAPYRMALQPLGGIAQEDVTAVRGELAATYRLEVTLLPAQPLPPSAWYAPRGRWRAERLLDSLDAQTPHGFDKVLGLAASDISTTKGSYPDWGIFGLGSLGGRPAVVSTFRLRRGNPSAALFRDRLTKVALHEVGHLFGLEHCPTPGCLMEDARGTIATVDRGGKTFCATCEEALREVGALR